MNTSSSALPITIEGDKDDLNYSLKISEDLVKRLERAKSCHVETKCGLPVAIIIDDYRAALATSKENQRVELMRIKGQKVVIESTLSEKMSIIPETLDTVAIRQRTEQAEKQRSSRKTVKIDDEQSMMGSPANKRVRSVSQISRPVPASSKSAVCHSNGSTGKISLEDELIHLLALEDMTMESLGLKLGCLPAQVQPLLAKIAVPNGILYKLKPAYYDRVDCVRWPKYSVKERQVVARRLGIKAVAASNAAVSPVKRELRPADITRLADQRVRQMMKSTRRKR